MASFEDIRVGPATLTAVNDEVVVSKPGMGAVTFQLVAGTTITVAFEALTQEGPTPSWVAIPATNVTTGTTATTATAAGVYLIAAAGFRRVRARVTAITGTWTMSGNASTGPTALNLSGLGGSASSITALVGGSTGTKTSVAAAASNTLLIAFNAGRLGATVVNESNGAYLYLSLGSSAASLTSYTKKLNPSEYYEIPFGFTGPVRGIWNAAEANAFARCTEVTL